MGYQLTNADLCLDSKEKKQGKLSKIPIPSYTLGEELISSISHGTGAILGIAALVLCATRASLHSNTLGIISSSIFGASIIILYAMSCLYHALTPCTAKKVMRIFDHCTIFLLIAGTYTPFTMVALKDSVGPVLFVVIWGCAIVGIVLNAIDMERYKIISMICYLGMGWAIIFAFNPLAAAVSKSCISFLVAGGLAYTFGAVVYGIGSKVKYMHSIWHFFVLAGTILHFFSIYLYVV